MRKLVVVLGASIALILLGGCDERPDRGGATSETTQVDDDDGWDCAGPLTFQDSLSDSSAP